MNRKFSGERTPREQYNITPTPTSTHTQASFGQIPFTQEELNSTRRMLSMQLGPEYVSTRAAFGGTKVAYLEGWKSINLANEMFGFNGWSSTIVDYTVDYLDVTDTGRVSLGMSCIMRVTLKDGTYHEDVGYGNIENAKTKSQAFEKVKKEAATDALKRALRTFGNSLGNCLYDKNFLKQISRFKAPTIKPLELECLYHHDSMKKEVERRELANPGPSNPHPHPTNHSPNPAALREEKDIPIKKEPVQSENFGFEDSDELFAQMADSYEFFANRSSDAEIPGQIERDLVTTEVIPGKQPVGPVNTNTPESIRKRDEGTSVSMCTPLPIRSGGNNGKCVVDRGGHNQCPTPPSTLASLPPAPATSHAAPTTPVPPPTGANPRRLIHMFNTSHDGPAPEREAPNGDTSNKGLKRQSGPGTPTFRPPMHATYTDRREIEISSPGSKTVKKTKTDAHTHP
ncbi:recombination protein Rad52 [Basidiobolus meristosporus CBS 931.73]|uniref:Recombination protein Rad52 n=1 Tax=Basidiobolus meristosporus CBS 931.73 TaxID=1314790 RepID=A0A1Y1YBK0_9FUNG|nr:recombination protein Rad52 [Basidiobolus meristosporus CBS 931.73]|eukprot:ORX95421.1 recombination protein Rad52 [Basidiobolus meristosporus CBS 931.73]